MSTVERQHELEQNSLAEWIVQLFDRIRPHLMTIVVAVVAAVGAIVAWIAISATNAASEAQSWEAYLAALSTGDTMAFNEVAQRYPGSDAALWSQLVLADMALTDGAVLAFEDRTASNERLESAVDLYTAVLAEGPGGLLAERATFGLAKAQESLGELDKAQQGYASVVKAYPDSPLAAVAQEHADALAGDSTKDWYDWFFAQKLTAVVPPAAGGAAADAATNDAVNELFEEGPVEGGTPVAEPAEETGTPDASPADDAAADNAAAADAGDAAVGEADAEDAAEAAVGDEPAPVANEETPESP